MVAGVGWLTPAFVLGLASQGLCSERCFRPDTPG